MEKGKAVKTEETSNSNKTAQIVVISLALLFLVIVVAQMAYSYFTATISGDPGRDVVQAGMLDINFNATEYFNNTNMMLIPDSERETKAESINFTVGHGSNATLAATYQIDLVDLVITDNFKSADVKYELLRGGSVVKTGNFSTIGSNNTLNLVSNVNLALASSHTYTLRLWLSENNTNQMSLLEGSFRGRVSVTAVPS